MMDSGDAQVLNVEGDADVLTPLVSLLEEKAPHQTRVLLERFVDALDYCNSETRWHSRRVSLYARRLAQQLGIAEPELTVIEHGALLHDIGKIGVRDRLLLKPSALSGNEWTEMKRHSRLGWAMVRRVGCLRQAAAIVLQHHERWDGTGYPARLVGNKIVVGARVLHLVDALDAMTSNRPYRRARSLADARDEIIRCRGTHFDPDVVRAFLAVNEEEWERIRIDAGRGEVLF